MINLLPYKEKKSIERIRSVRFIRTVVVGFACICLIAGMLLLPTLLTINSRFSLANNQIRSLENEGALATEVDIADIENRSRVVGAKLFVKTEDQPTLYVETVKSLVSSGISIGEFTLSESKVMNISGVAKNREVLQAFIKSLETSDKIAKVDSPVSNFVKNSNISFRLTINFK